MLQIPLAVCLVNLVTIHVILYFNGETGSSRAELVIYYRLAVLTEGVLQMYRLLDVRL